jgi:hypothetical protein
MIMYAEEKSNDRLDRLMMARFRQFALEQEIKDLYPEEEWQAGGGGST